MAILSISATARGLCTAGVDAPLELTLERTLRRVPHKSPLLVMVHGYKYSPYTAHRHPATGIFADRPIHRSGRYVSWPLGMGFTRDSEADGLAIGFAWPAAPTDEIAPPLEGFRRAYGRASDAGRHLARLLDMLDEIAPGREVDLIAHSLGARVALCAMRQVQHARLGQVILMGGAEYDETALSCLRHPAAAASQVFNVTMRANVMFDRLFQRMGPPKPPGARPVSQGLADRARNVFDLPLDQPETAVLLARRGCRIAAERKRVCHWSFYTRPGALALYARILRERHNWQLSPLRAEAATLEPSARRWRLPRLRLPGTPPSAGSAPIADI